MFSTLDHKSFQGMIVLDKTVVSSHESKQKAGAPPNKTKPVKFLGAKSKSVGGCATCRHRKKKCDEVHPSCGFCTRRNIPCSWPPPRPRKKYERKNKIQNIPKSETQSENVSAIQTTSKQDVQRIESFDSLEENSKAFSFMSGILNSTEIDTKTSSLESIVPYDENDADERASVTTSMILSGIKTPDLNMDHDESYKQMVSFSPGLKEGLDKFTKMLSSEKFTYPNSAKESWLADKGSPFEILMDSQASGPGFQYNYFEKFIENCLNPSPSKFYSTNFEVKLAFKHMESSLSDKGFKFLEYYIFYYSNSITICPADSNYFVKTFLPLAYSCEPILYALVSWGCLMYHSQDEARVYLHKATSLMYKTIEAKNSKDKTYSDYQHFKEMCSFFLILIGWEICSGDTNNWYHLLAQCKELICKYGGFQKISEMSSHSNDIKWLISNFQFHDVFASRSLETGTFFLMSEYENVLEEDISYGIDPIQGLARPLNTILGEISNCSSRMKEERKQLEEEFSRSEIDSITYNSKRLAYYEKCETVAAYFESRISSCRPNKRLLALVKEESSIERHLTLFELYSYVCMFYVEIYIRQLPPKSIKLQTLLLRSLELIDILIDTVMMVSLPLPLLIAAQTCYMPSDRDDMRKRLQNVSKGYHIGNFARMVEIIEESWELNPDGSKILDWTEITHNRGWNLYVG
ncbi:hypothetical protein CLIB1423_43S00232 [[Candida] railenensis]|uniref:Zn(2)-C6 fungal-type domain-containing protein n=1 Tax=[Candida] railenensis TaxID=45579 RepID=A0A9P0QXE4_9ASCO|nr:hypothetical protein CLIB1423_43S00232 [[Candida] railenensis]